MTDAAPPRRPPEPQGKSLLFYAACFGALLATTPWILEAAVRKDFTIYSQFVSAALVTGAASGIGEATVHEFVKQGLVVYAGVRKESDFQVFADNPAVIPILLDVNDEKQIKAAVAKVTADVEKSGKIFKCVVNNAAFATVAPVEFHDPELINDMFKTNVLGALRVTQAFLPLLRKNKGRVINVSSVISRVPIPEWGGLAASKAALEALSDALRIELAALGVSVSVVRPGVIKTPALGKVKQNTKTSPEATSVYSHLYTPERLKLKEGVAAKAVDAEGTAETIYHALASPTPATYYATGGVMGIPTTILIFLANTLPDRVLDWIWG